MLKVPKPIDPEPAIIDILRQALILEFKTRKDERIIALGLMAILTAYAPIAALLGSEAATGIITEILSGLSLGPLKQDDKQEPSESPTRH